MSTRWARHVASQYLTTTSRDIAISSTISCARSITSSRRATKRRVCRGKLCHSVHPCWKADETRRYWAYKNAWSMDGLPAMKLGMQAGKQYTVEPLKKMVGPLAPSNNQRFRSGLSVEAVMLIALLSFIVGASLALYSPILLPLAQAKLPQGGLLNTTISGDPGYLVSFVKR